MKRKNNNNNNKRNEKAKTVGRRLLGTQKRHIEFRKCVIIVILSKRYGEYVYYLRCERTIRCAIPDNGKNKTIFNVVLLLLVVATAAPMTMMMTTKTEDDDKERIFLPSSLTITLPNEFFWHTLMHVNCVCVCLYVQATRYTFQARK